MGKKSSNPKPKRIRKTGMPPGSLIYTGVQSSSEIILEYVRYNAEYLHELDFSVEHPMEPNFFYWLDVRGTNNPAEIESIGKRFNIDPLLLEDILDAGQRPKFEHAEKTIFVLLKNLIQEEQGGEFKNEQICLYLTENLLITFQEYPDDTFHALKVRMQQASSRLRSRRPDYLMYAIIDFITDHYFSVLDTCSDRIHQLEGAINENPDLELKNNIYYIRQDIIELHRILLPTRETISAILRSDNPLLTEKTRRYYRDIMDTMMQVLDINDNQGEHLSSLHDLFVSEMTYRMTNVMKILTVVTSIFIPLTFITSIYGMNFKYMPELYWPWAYGAVWVIMIIVSIVLLFYFRRKRWL